MKRTVIAAGSLAIVIAGASLTGMQRLTNPARRRGEGFTPGFSSAFPVAGTATWATSLLLPSYGNPRTDRHSCACDI